MHARIVVPRSRLSPFSTSFLFLFAQPNANLLRKHAAQNEAFGPRLSLLKPHLVSRSFLQLSNLNRGQTQRGGQTGHTREPDPTHNELRHKTTRKTATHESNLYSTSMYRTGLAVWSLHCMAFSCFVVYARSTDTKILGTLKKASAAAFSGYRYRYPRTRYYRYCTDTVLYRQKSCTARGLSLDDLRERVCPPCPCF